MGLARRPIPDSPLHILARQSCAMTNVFVSYARPDKERVEPIVAFIDSVVGDVWWDDRLIAGEYFTDEVERRLNEADFVVVVWTPTSVRSKWVMDEAAVGRDAEKLLPVCLDGQIAPLGFRHVHATDFSKWDGTPNDKCARALREALTRKPGEARPPAPKASPAGSPPRSRWRLAAIAAAAVVAVAVAVVAVIQFGPWQDRNSIAVLPFADLSPDKNRGYFADGIAEEILSALARDPALRVIGSASSAKFVGGKFDVADVRRALDVEHVLEGSVRAIAGRIKINVALLRTRDGVRVWSEQYDRPEYEVFAIENEIGKAVADRLGGEGEAVTVASTTSVTALDLLLEARQKLRMRTEDDLLKARGLLERAIALDPDSAAIHGALAEAVYFTANADFDFFRDKREDPNKARQLAEKAIVLAPDRADGYAALSLILNDQQAAQRPIVEKAVALDPSRSDLRMWLNAHEKDREKRVEGLRTIIALDPLWQTPVRNLAQNLTLLGRYEEAERVIADYAARAPDDKTSPNLFRGEMAEERGELASAYKAYSRIEPQTADTAFARSHVLAILGMDKEAAALVPNMEAPPDAWRRRDSDALFRLTNAIPRFITAIPYEMFADHRRVDYILQLYDSKLGAADQFCAKIADFGVTRGAPALVWALNEVKRNAEAKTVSACAEAELRKALGLETDIKGVASGAERGFPHFYIAQLDALGGKRSSAMANLRKALELKYHGNSYSLDFREYRAFDALQGVPEFLAMQKRIDAEAARQRAEIERFDRENAQPAQATP
jgi:TolB-like protein